MLKDDEDSSRALARLIAEHSEAVRALKAREERRATASDRVIYDIAELVDLARSEAEARERLFAFLPKTTSDRKERFLHLAAFLIATRSNLTDDERLKL
jgi:hypothetical protein